MSSEGLAGDRGGRQQVVRVPFAEDLLARLAQDILAVDTGTASDLASCQVLLPSARACRTLSHRLLEESARATLLLPRIQTLPQWAEDRAAALGLAPGGATAEWPDDRVRHLALAPLLAERDWLQGRSENAPGLALEFIQFFDLVRLHRRSGMLLESDSLAEVLQRTGAASQALAEIITSDLGRAREAWQLYRQVIARDAVDRLLEVSATTAGSPGGPGWRPALILVAGFGRIDPTSASLLKTALASAPESRVYLPMIGSARSEKFAGTWGTESAGSSPLAPTRRLARALDLVIEDEVPPARGSLAPPIPEILACPDPESESRLIAHRIVEELQRSGGSQRRIAVAVADPRLAARISAQLNDAGIDHDSTHGQPLSTLPGGLLLRAILRAAVTDLRAEHLLEVLTHPYVNLPVSEGTHGRWTLRLEKLFRRNEGPQGGLAGLGRKARERDRAARELFARQGPGMTDFVDLIGQAFAPLLLLPAGKEQPWPILLAAVQQTWRFLAAERPLIEQPDRPDLTAVSRLLGILGRDAGNLPPTSLGGFAADLGRLLAAENTPAHRARHLPVMVTGLLEARLERFDLLFLAGMREGVFPARQSQPLLLGWSLQKKLGLPDWRDALAREAELFLRLLHNAPRVLITWAVEVDGQPVLPSAFVSRLQMVLEEEREAGEESTAWQEPPLWRRHQVPWLAIEGTAAAFAGEDPAPRAVTPVRPLGRLSWSGLRLWRECPRRFLLERGFGLKREEEVQREFGRMDYGNLVHETLRDFLDPETGAVDELVAGDGPAAGSILEEIAGRRFLPGSSDLPIRKLWLNSFRRTFPAVISHEIDRLQQWRPVTLEAEFRLKLADLGVWLTRQAKDLDFDLAGDGGLDTGIVPDLGDLPEDIVLRGTIDRIDRRVAKSGKLAVLDYKTGAVPSAARIADLQELQVTLYSAALEAGSVAACGPEVEVQEASYYQISEDRCGPPARPHLDCADPEGRRLLLAGTVQLIHLAVQAGAPDARYPLLPGEWTGTGDRELPCRFCDFRGVCRLEERDDLPAATLQKLDRIVNRKEGW